MNILRAAKHLYKAKTTSGLLDPIIIAPTPKTATEHTLVGAVPPRSARNAAGLQAGLQDPFWRAPVFNLLAFVKDWVVIVVPKTCFPLCSTRTTTSRISLKYQLTSESMWCIASKFICAVLAADSLDRASATAIAKGATVASGYIATLTKNFTDLVKDYEAKISAFAKDTDVEKAMTTDLYDLGSQVTAGWVKSTIKDTLETTFNVAGVCFGGLDDVSQASSCGGSELRSLKKSLLLKRNYAVTFYPAQKLVAPSPLNISTYGAYQILTSAKPAAAGEYTWGLMDDLTSSGMLYLPTVTMNFYTNKKTPKVPTYACDLIAMDLRYTLGALMASACPTKTSFSAIISGSSGQILANSIAGGPSAS
ncbi:hypothetical protein BDK51DRAFT_46700 [Blyttiomyces helicus]|uniref:Uncharacterized protein n=1 Tax=Blyttiomyces helicus TaxID=388810 RepID=A0A4P9VWC8_9FUNG|nr:hypothetical protein BDK51DRAFT_46700 [Blyttiomyces helicus]|eukprot:RKO84009.1 hypothetical protein BDK51DRAFT_46700 [Blyttiomyces helicus]